MSKSDDEMTYKKEQSDTAKRSPVSAIEYPKTSEIVQKHIERLIITGVMRPGEKLPPERILAEDFGVSRNILRDALKVLGAKNLIRSTQGGGNYVNEVIGAEMTDPLASLLRENTQAMDDFMEFRCEFESSVAHLAAARATHPDIRALKLIFERMEAAHLAKDQSEESSLDADFHMALAEASHNIVITHISYSLKVIMQQELLHTRLVLFDESNGVRGSTDRQMVLEQHREILNAVSAHDSDRAATAMRNHIRFIREKLREIGTSAERHEIASERLARWTSRV
ncbi:FadR/GntR family transcriptional regulator [Rhizobium sp. BK399]|uniref:FadR/GntR family transcriptional regulator n=1 Tax=Rhizobium sp. BK399 TaxID=2587063 RepID=UPI001622517B|nr:FadR/GntR family transcriptional regulator [Rhizobium sp. BK399]MBB3544599.1 GntR family transcriptional repressor for pyruvate dehydrogenase complex [Rhizobium sp. BK399]